MITLLDIRLAYKADTGHYPFKGDDSSMIKGFNKEEDLYEYVKWLEEQLIESKETIKLIQKYKL